jgi:hypothetical protein
MRRAQALLVVVALLATPLALLAGVNSCAQVMCPMCAAAAQHAKGTKCNCPASHTAGKCGSSGQTQFPDFALANALAPTAPLPFFEMNPPSTNRAVASDLPIVDSRGFLYPPVAPPRS